MSNEPDLVFALKLYDKTKSGAIEWTETSDERAFQVELKAPPLKVQVAEMEDADTGGYFYVLRLVNGGGRVIHRIFAPNLSAAEINKKYGFLNLLERLYEDARRKALGVDVALKHATKAIDEMRA